MLNNNYPNIRFTREDSAILFVDHQVGLILGVHDHDHETLRRNVITLARAAKVYGLPAIVTSSADDGPNGPILPELVVELPDIQVIKRPGEIDAFDNPDFAAAVKATGRKNLIISGISTDVCVAFAALSAVAAGYNVQAVLDASGTWSHLAAEAAIIRMRDAGVTMTSSVAMTAELQRDWRNPGGEVLGSIYAEKAIPFYSSLIAMTYREPR
ncbi:MAG: isochorismatase family protein [Deltaproteobacteria bacterium]|nr:isochorismatase family protein [Deltaproteobacteria bacterium]